MIVPFLALCGRFATRRLLASVDAGDLLAAHRSWLADRRDDRTFSYLHLSDLHEPVDPPPGYWAAHDVDESVPGIRRWRHEDVARDSPTVDRYRIHREGLYEAAVDHVDDRLAARYAQVRDLVDDALLVVVGDHGEGFWEMARFHADHFADSRPAYCVGHGGAPYEAVTRVPLAVARSGDPAVRGEDLDARASLVDVAPTVLDAVGIDAVGRDAAAPREPGVRVGPLPECSTSSLTSFGAERPPSTHENACSRSVGAAGERDLTVARIAVAHVDLMAKGGGEGVCVEVVDALAAEHEVTLLTLSEPDWPELASYFDVDLPDVSVGPAPTVARLFDRVEDPLHNLRLAALNRHVRRHEADFDLVVGTDNELSVRSPSVQYVHTPRFGRLVTTKRVGEDAFLDHLYDRLSYRVGGYDVERLRSAHLLTNSRYMANVVQDAYGVRPRVVHPPVDTRGFADVPWAERESGFLTVGRLTSYKNVEATVRVVDGLRERGHDVHQHVVGPAYDDAYARKIESMAVDREYVHLEGELPREELVELVSEHRYGLHGKRNEHFGMVVAELAAGGAIPFVPDSGGQREIVEDPAHQSYATPADAVDRIDRVLSDADLQARLRTGPAGIERRFGRERFRETIRDVVDDALAGPASTVPTAPLPGE